MRKFTRWQDWVALVAGVYAMLAPIWTPTQTIATWSMVVLGAVLAVSALWSLMAPGAVASEWIHAGIGVLMIIAPFAMGFTALFGMALTAWIAGVVALALGLWGVPLSSKAHHEHALPQG